MARLSDEFLTWVEHACDRVVAVAEALDEAGVPRRISDQVLASGASIGANAFEADEAMSRKDFVKCLCIAVKECNETRFWLRLIGRHQWIRACRLGELESEVVEIKNVMGAMIANTIRSQPRPRSI
ncbi:MAG: four helix bundle protein [Phycisphaerales bacterium]|jgi:four helix bundle protein